MIEAEVEVEGKVKGEAEIETSALICVHPWFTSLVSGFSGVVRGRVTRMKKAGGVRPPALCR